MYRVIIGIMCLIVGGVILSGCDDGTTKSATQRESQTQGDNYKRLVAAQPSHTMGYSPTRDTINFWIDTWGKPGKLSYVYLQSADGTLLGYYIFKGLPVNYCAAQTPTYKIYRDSDGNVLTPAPSIDGVYYSGGQCNTFYGRDASNNAYVEYTAGLGINVLLYDRPLPRQDAKPLAFATVENTK